MKSMRRLAVVVALLVAPVCLAGPLEDAKAALDQKQFDKVDVILEKDLKARQPSVDALRLSLQAAEAQGHVITAHKRINALLKAIDNKDADLVYRSAEIADRVGDGRVALIRYLTYARAVNDKTPKLQLALEYALRRESYVPEYKKYVTLFGATPAAWDLGAGMLSRLVDAGDDQKVLELAEFMQQSYPKPENVTHIHATLRGAADGFLFGKEPKDRYLRPLMVMVKGAPTDMSHIDWVLGQCDPALPLEARVKLCIDYAKFVKGPVTWGFLSRIQQARDLPTEEARLAVGRDYLALEPIYQQSTWAEAYDYYSRVLLETPQIFAIKDKVLLPPAEAIKRLETFKQKYKDQPGRWVGPLQNTLQYVTDPAARAQLLRANISYLNFSQVADLLNTVQGKDYDAIIAQACQGRNYRDQIDIRNQTVNFAIQAKNKAAIVSITRDYMLANPGDWNPVHVQSWFIATTELTADEKLAVLNEVIAKQGISPSMKALAAELVKAKEWAENPKFKELQNTIKANPAGSDLLQATLVNLATLKGNPAAPPKELTAIMDRFFAEYKGTYPAAEETVKDLQELLVTKIYRSHWWHVSQHRKAVGNCMTTWMGKFPPGPLMEGLVQNAASAQFWPELHGLAKQYIAATKAANVPGNPQVWAWLSNAQHPKDDRTPLFTDAYDRMPANAAINYLFNQREAFAKQRQLLVDESAKVLAIPGKKVDDIGILNQWVNHIWSWSGPEVKVPPTLTKALWESYLGIVETTKKPDLFLEACIWGLYSRNGQEKEAQEFLKTYLTMIQKRTPMEQIDSLSAFFRHQTLPLDPQATTQPNGTPVESITDGYRRGVVFNVFLPLLAQVQPADYSRVVIVNNVMEPVNSLVGYSQYPAVQQKAIEAARQVVKCVAGGMRAEVTPGYWYPIMMILCQEAIAKEDWNEVNRLTDLFATMMAGENNWESLFTNQINPLVKTLEEKKAYECIFAFMVSIERRSNPLPTAAKQLVMLKSRASTYIPDMIAVPPDDPSYDLHMAVQALTLANETRAWELTGPKLKLLPEVWETLDPTYVAWVTEQMRKQKMLKEGLDLCFKILLKEQDLEPEVGAAMLLTKGDIYRDMENYQASRIEYEGLRANPRYAKTKAGSRGIYRLIDLHIITKNYVAAEQLLERMIDADNLEMQAEAYYLLAKMAYQKGEYTQSKDYVRKVKDRVINHVEATLLEGQLNLVVRGGLTQTDVAIGDPRLNTIAVPGRPLELKLQDQNLSIARAGKDIPVIITTTKGDTERVSLRADASSKNLFTGSINTALGKITKNNLMLELKGDDQISYVIDPEFQKANDINYPPKVLEVRYDARLTASSGEILTEEEEEKRELERQLNRRRILESRQMDIARDGRTVRPGSKIFVQVMDFDRDLTDEPDKVLVNLKTAGGDLLENFALTETGPNTGIFRGAVPTAVPLPKASASDTEEGKNPSSMILAKRTGDWSSMADGKKPKWVEVDTMSSCDVSTIQLQVPHLENVKELSVLGLLADEYEELACWPARGEEAKGGLMLDIAPDQAGASLDQMKKHLRLAGNKSQPNATASFDRSSTEMKGRDGWLTTRLRGMFYHDGGTVEFKFMQNVSPGDWQWAYLVIDGQVVLGGCINGSTIGAAGRTELAKGVHTMELYVRDHWGKSRAEVGYRKDDGTFEAIDAEWFNPEKKPALKEALKARASLKIEGDMLNVELPVAKRLRKVRVLFKDFTNTAITVQQFTIKDAKGQVVVPGNEDFTKGVSNKTLEVAPGDEIEITYSDEKRLREDSKLLSAGLNSSYFNASIMLADETIWQNPNQPTERRTTYQAAKRCREGNQLTIVVTDYDADTTEERDTIDVLVTTSSGEKLAVKALETWPNGDGEEQKHAGMFLAMLKIGAQTGKDTIKVAENDHLTVTYLDKENTNPGVPYDRSYTMTSAERSDPKVLVYNTSITLVPDTSPEAKARLSRLAGRDVKDAVMFKPLIVARHPQYLPAGQADNPTAPAASQPTGKEVTVSVAAPLLFEIAYPRVCLNLGSELEVTAVAESELKAAQRENREPKTLKVPTHVMSLERLSYVKGYPLQLQAFQYQRRSEQEMLRDGSFSGVIRLQVGSPGDVVDDLVVTGEKEFATQEQRESDKQGFYFRVPTLIVSGNDTVILRVKNVDTNNVVEQRVRLLSDANLELLDKTYLVQNEAINLGDKFFVRLTDPDHDVSDNRDTVQVTVASSSGDKVAMALNETLPHSGIFTGNIKPDFLGEASSQPASGQATSKPADTTDDVLSVSFGDTVTFTYTDDRSVSSDKPIQVAKSARIFHGSDGQLATFTKRFKDPEIAVKTRFLMAEALFEMAKEHRKLSNKTLAEQEIVRGKDILEEALRDYPDTSLAVQGEYLLANLAQELGADDAKFYTEAINRYSHLLSAFGDSEYAANAQYKMALCYEKQGNFDQACEEYVKLTYIYPDSSFVAEATVRLGNYYYKNQKYNIAAKIFLNFQQRNPAHKLAASAMFIGAQCYYKQADWPECVKIFDEVVKQYPDEKDIRAEALYWMGDGWVKCAQERGDPDGYKNAYQTFKKLTWDYPESKWAKHARGRLTENSFANMEE